MGRYRYSLGVAILPAMETTSAPHLPEPAPLSRLTYLLLGLGLIVVVVAVLLPPHDTTLVPFGLFALALLFRGRITRWTAAHETRPGWAFGLLVIVFGLLSSSLMWLSAYFSQNSGLALFGPWLTFQLIAGLGFYLGCALAWEIVLWRWSWSLRAVLFGVLFWIERTSIGRPLSVALADILNILRLSLQTMPLPIVFGLLSYIVVLYGPAIGLSYLPLQPLFVARGKPHHWIKVPVALILLAVLSMAGLFAILTLAQRLGFTTSPSRGWEVTVF